MNKILFIRHAETDLTGTFCGQSDPPVNARGLLQLEELAMRRELSECAAIYSSDLQRARTTAERIAKVNNAPIIEAPALREIHFGDWEGLSWAQIEQRDAPFAARWADEFPKLPAPGGECYEDFKERVLAIVTKVTSLAGEDRIAVVTHGGVMRLVLMELCRKSPAKAWPLTQRYCSSFIYAPASSSMEECE